VAQTTAQAWPGREPWADDGLSIEALLNILKRSRPRWQADAACKEHPEITWFPDKGQTTAAAKKVCAGCLVRAECQAFALAQDDSRGVWGGLSERELRALSEPPRRVSYDRDDVIRRYQAGERVVDIAGALGISDGLVAKVLTAAGIVRRPRAQRSAPAA